ncbi:ensconsin-like isoform X46 [Tachysurus ichikawai]
MREQALLEKERRARLQYERTREERWRRLEEQRQKEEQRRAAVEEKRRHQLEEEKERLEALMRKSLERSLQLENRNKRGTYGMNGQSDYTLPYDLIASSPPTNELGNVPSSPHRSLYCASPSRHRANAVALEMGRANSVPNTPKKKKLHTERRTPAGSPVRRAESPADVIRHVVSPKFSPTHTHNRNQSPVPRRHYTSSPLRPPTILTDDKVTANRQAQEGKGHDPAYKKLLTEMKVSVEHVKGTCKAQSPKPTDSSTDRSSLTSGKAVARTTNGDEVAHILAEQQRLSHIQKEREEKDRLKAEQQKKNQEDMKEKKMRKADEEKELQEKQEVERELIKQQEEQERQQRKKRIEEIMKRTRKRDGELKRDDSQELHSPPSNTHSHTPPVLHNTPALNPPDRRGTALNVETAPVTPQRSSPMREEQSTLVKRINSSSQKLQEAQVKISEENHEKKLLPVKDREQDRGQVISPELTQMTKQESGGQVKCYPSEQVKSPTSQQVNSQVKSPTSQQVNSQMKSPTSQQMNSQMKSPTSQQMNSQVKSPTSPTSQQMNSQVKSPTSQQVNSQVKSPTSQQVNSQVKSPTSCQVNRQMKSEQVNGQASSQVKTTMMPSQVTSKKTSESSFPLSPLPHSQFPPTLSDLEYLEKGDGARRESADAVQSMEFSPISKEELISIPKFSPLSEVQKVVNSTRVLEDLLDLTGHVTYPIMQYSTTHGDCNKNVIEPKQTTNTLNMRSRKE